MNAFESPRVDERAVIVFDGVCVLCNGWVKFLLRRDRGRLYRFAAMQSVTGRHLLQVHGLNPDDPVSFLLVAKNRAWSDSDAIREVLVTLGGAWRAAQLLQWVPRRFRDGLYRLIARNRYSWFGRHDSCYLPSASDRDRFLN